MFTLKSILLTSAGRKLYEPYATSKPAPYIPTAAEQRLIDITDLEATITARRLREAIGGDIIALAFIADIESQIALIR